MRMKDKGGRGRGARLAALTLACAALLAPTGARCEGDAPFGYEAILSPQNPVPKIAEEARPAVVQVIGIRNRSQEVAYGSGVYVDDRGYVLTNSHVLEGADAADVKLLDGTRISAEGIYKDAATDIAMLKIAPLGGVKPVPLGDSDALAIGELAIVIGNPGTSGSVFYGTVSVGVISGLNRDDFSGTSFERSVSVIQTDAAINFGNSGGAFLNGRGELVGMPTLKIGSDWYRSYENLGFAIPINTIKPVMRSLIEYGVVRRPRIGVTVSESDGPEIAMRRYPPAGLKVDAVLPDSPAEESGVLPMDIITHVDGARVKTLLELSRELDARSEGEAVSFTVRRHFDHITGSALENPKTIEIAATLRILGDEGADG